MRHASLFSGIGGFDLASKWMGWTNVFHCEWNPFCQTVLRYHFPRAEGYGDITKTDFTKYYGTIDILTGGFPCQPFSVAGEQLGIGDPRHLWPAMLRAIREIRPPWIVGENVLGIIGWNEGMVFEQVQLDLENEGYEIIPVILPAIGVGADHERKRVWFIAYSDRFRQQRGQNKPSGQKGDQQLAGFQPANTWQYLSRPISYDGKNGVSTRLDGIAFSKWRDQANQAAGNAIVPQVALQIFKAIQEYESLT